MADQTIVDATFADLARAQATAGPRLTAHPHRGARVSTQGIAIREILLHCVEEYARHCGHADLLRECIDGRIGQ